MHNINADNPLKFQIMPPLHNRVSQKELKERLYSETEPRITISFYRYFRIEDPKTLP